MISVDVVLPPASDKTIKVLVPEMQVLPPNLKPSTSYVAITFMGPPGPINTSLPSVIDLGGPADSLGV